MTTNDLDARPVRRDELAQHGHEATRDPFQLSLKEENLLLRRYAQSHDPALREELCRRLLPLAQSLALRYRDRSEQLDDLMQVASLGLVKALDGFDPTRGVPFPAYAAPTILGELRRHFRDRVWDVHLPRGLQERVMAVTSAAGTLAEEQGRTPTVRAIASRLGLSEEEVAEALAADEARHTWSLDAPTAGLSPTRLRSSNRSQKPERTRF